MKISPILLKDGYKVGHKFQYPEGTTLVYSNMTPRKSRVVTPSRDGAESTKDSDQIVFFGLQYFIKEYLMHQFNAEFFKQPKDLVLKQYKRRIDNYLGKDSITINHIADLHDLGYLPLEIKALTEGVLVPMKIPVMTMVNTKPEFFWLTNMLETVLSAVLWKPITSATTAARYLKTFREYAQETVGDDESFIAWQGHDFSFRGMSGIEDATMSAAGHLLSFAGTDTIPAIDFLEQYYNADSDVELVGGSVPATEHSVASSNIIFFAEMVDSVEEEWDEENNCWTIKNYQKNGKTVQNM